jgi:hypothetical protein
MTSRVTSPFFAMRHRRGIRECHEDSWKLGKGFTEKRISLPGFVEKKRELFL